MANSNLRDGAVCDARSLGKPKMLALGLQHMFAMFGATVLVPAITGLSVSATLLFAGLGTLLFHLVTRFKVPAFLGSSFAFIGGYAAVKEMGMAQGLSAAEALPYACLGVFFAGVLYFVLAGLFAVFGAKRVMSYFPPIVTGPIIISIGLILSGSAIANCSADWWIAILAIAIIVVSNIWGRGMVRIVPILLGVAGSYAVFSIFSSPDWGLALSSVITIMPIALATMVEHIGDMCAISSTVGRNYLADPGLHRTLAGDGLATSLASLFGAPANTTYGENTGVLNLTKVFDPRVIRLAAVFAILFSFSPKFAALVSSMPTATIGGVSLVLYGMISAVGIRNIVENKVDFTASRNVIIAAIILVLAIGIKYGAGDAVSLGFTSLSGLAVAAIVGIALNAVLPGKDYEFGRDLQGDTSVDFEVNRVTDK